MTCEASWLICYTASYSFACDTACARAIYGLVMSQTLDMKAHTYVRVIYGLVMSHTQGCTALDTSHYRFYQI